MNELVFLEPNRLDAVPFTTSDVISQFAGVQHHTITRLLRKYKEDFEELGLLGFEIHAVNNPGNRGTKYTKTFHLNEQQATLLITYLQNTPQVRAFKKELVRQFFQMRTELNKRQMLRADGKPIQRDFTDVVKEKDSSPWAYSKYTNLVYKSAIGKNAAQLRKERGARRDAKAIDYMSSAEMEAVNKRKQQISTLLEIGMDYDQIKALVMDRRLMGTIAAAAVTSDTA